MAVLAGELTTAAAARQAKVSEQSISNWKRQVIETGRAGLAAGTGKPSTREQQLRRHVRAVVDAAPPLTTQQIARLRPLLANSTNRGRA